MADLFEDYRRRAVAPLADRMRPRTLDEFMGQEHLVGPGRIIRAAIESDNIPSMILWGPPGCGKTTLAQVIAQVTRRVFVTFSAVLQGVKEVRAIVEEARVRLGQGSGGTILFVDEIHRFNKSQQDAFLPHVESGIITLIGATTENPSFEVNGALLSRCRTCVLRALTDDDIARILDTALADADRGLGKENIILEPEARSLIANFANGDARSALNALELAAAGAAQADGGARIVTPALVRETISRRVSYDNKGEEHYNLISALHKSLRGSDPQAAVYWLARMLEGGADPLYVARRLVRFASEDVGLADPNALVQAIAARDAAHFLGMPECNVSLTQAVVYLATAPKSNRLETAYLAARADVENTRNEPVPLHIRNAPTRLMKDLGYGSGYVYDHDAPDSFSGQSHLPQSLEGRVYYEPGPYGFEKDIKRRLEYWDDLRARRKQ